MNQTARALGYPYDIPAHSYVLKDGMLLNWPKEMDLEGRTPVLACGSNQSPSQLMRKFKAGIIPVMAGWLKGYDSVYSAHFTTYGAIAATYHPAPQVLSRQMITWLDQEQLEIMHATEALGINYDYIKLEQLNFQSDCSVEITSAFTYQSLHGPVKKDGHPIAIQSIDAQNRPFCAMTQTELQEYVLQAFQYQKNLADFIETTISDETERKARTVKLKQL